MFWDTPIKLKWALLAVVVASITYYSLTTDGGGSWGVMGISGWGYGTRCDSVIDCYKHFEMNVGFVPALLILVWQYFRSRRQSGS